MPKWIPLLGVGIDEIDRDHQPFLVQSNALGGTIQAGARAWSKAAATKSAAKAGERACRG